jgi:diaminohydroxyphosphoribosylaminopyrimidine deaminase/5-amino-6-(5-phosphoribosylamino)uracil reductase
VVLDSGLSLPRTLRLFRARSPAPTVVAHAGGEPPPARPGVEFLRCRSRGGRVDLADLLRRLARRGVTSLLVEGGAEVNRAFLEAGLVDRVVLFLAPKLVGGDGLSWVAGPGARRMSGALALLDVEVARVGADILVRGRPAGRLAKGPARG